MDEYIVKASNDFASKCFSCEYSNNCQLKDFVTQVNETGITKQLVNSPMYKRIYHFYSTTQYREQTFLAICGLHKK